MRDLNDLYYFVQVVDHGGYAPAGRALGIPKSKLSRRILELEERLGVRLLQRSTRQLAVTEVGQLEELAPTVRPAGGFDDQAGVAAFDVEPVVAGVGVGLHKAAAGGQMALGMLAAAVT